MSILDSLYYIPAFAVFLLFAMTAAACTDYAKLIVSVVSCSTSGLLLGYSALDTSGLHFSRGAASFSCMMFGLSLIYRLYGAGEVRRALRCILLSLAMVHGTLLLLDFYKVLSPAFHSSIRGVGIHFFSICLMESLLLGLLELPHRIPALLYLPLVSLIAGASEGLISYPLVALSQQYTSDILEYTALSLASRLLTTLLSIPFLAAALWLETHYRLPRDKPSAEPVPVSHA